MDSTAIEFIGNLGFPIAVTWFVLTRLEKKLEGLFQEYKRTNILLAVLVKILSDGNTQASAVSIPTHIVDEVSGVVDVEGGEEKK